MCLLDLLKLNDHTDYVILQILTDWHLVGILLAVAGIDVFILFLGDVIPPLRDSVPQEQDAENPQTINVNKI